MYNLLIASNLSAVSSKICETLNKNTSLLEFSPEANNLPLLKELIQNQLNNQKVSSMGFLLDSSRKEIYLCNAKVLTQTSWKYDKEVIDFFEAMQNMLTMNSVCSIDFLGVKLDTSIAAQLTTLMEKDLNVLQPELYHTKIRIAGDICGFDNGSGVSLDVWETYCHASKLKAFLTSSDKKLTGYEKLRTVGKGAFGTAVLYKKQDGSLIVIKEINMMELTASERQMALNEVQVLSVMDHPNIIKYYRSFETEGILMIEMEYANGGTLSQFLTKQTEFLIERDIIYLFKQIVSAIEYMHARSILHRDLKTANIFLTKEKIIKVGDFGISKVMSTKAQAQTVLGTPYYISPEMCEGKQYDQKSDIWALGCILYEMICLQKAFQGSNLPALVNSIMKGEFQPIPKGYSIELNNLIRDILQKDPSNRPTGPNILFKILHIEQNVDTNESQRASEQISYRDRSVLYELSGQSASIKLDVIALPPKVVVKQVAVSTTHYVVLTSDHTVYTWGEGLHGQLGHGDSIAWKDTPALVKGLQDRLIKMVAAGDGFSIFISDSGMLMTCGDGSFGCLGHSDWVSVSKPKLIEKLLQMDISSVSCGSRHVAIINVDNELYTWGQGQGGRLGLGDEEERCYPCRVSLPRNIVLQSVKCGVDGTMLITSSGTILATGVNAFNKLGLSHSRCLISHEVEKSVLFTYVHGLPSGCIDASLGPDHTVILTDKGYVYTMGNNAEAQVGHDNNSPTLFKKMTDHIVTMVQAGQCYTAVGTSENVVFVWGRWTDKFQQELHIFTNKNGDHLTNPQEILALFSSPQQIALGHKIALGGLIALPQSLFVFVHTTAPLLQNHPSTKHYSDNATYLNDNSDEDSYGKIPQWIKMEAAQSEGTWPGYSSSSTITQAEF